MRYVERRVRARRAATTGTKRTSWASGASGAPPDSNTTASPAQRPSGRFPAANPQPLALVRHDRTQILRLVEPQHRPVHAVLLVGQKWSTQVGLKGTPALGKPAADSSRCAIPATVGGAAFPRRALRQEGRAR